MGLTLGGCCCLGENAIELFARIHVPLAERGVVVELMNGGVEAPNAVDADVLFACGLLTREWIDDGRPFEIVAAPIFPGETSAVYRSVVVVRDDGPIDLADAQTGTLAVNEYGSWSGWNGYVDDLRAHGLPVPSRRVLTGGHRNSATTVREGLADVAAIDSSLWRWLPTEERAGLRIVHETQDWPAPPFSLRHGTPEAARTALLDLANVVPASVDAYDDMLDRRTPIS
ncbi:MAG: PhnD/SsuA/transferrin family substrate-binding protein [Actinomycetota bacterium]